MGLINLIEDPTNPAKAADTHTGKPILHVTLTSVKVSAACVSGFMSGHTALSQM